MIAGIVPRMLPPVWAEALADHPQVHDAAASGVWSTEQACYELIANHVDAASSTLETGIGMSTVLFAALGCAHTCVFLEPVEGERLTAWCDKHDVSLDDVDLRPGGSDVVLPALGRDELDLVFIDGSHGYPFPQIDFYYAASRLHAGGILVIDDVNLLAPRHLVEYLEADDRWERLELRYKWAAYRRRSSGSLGEDFDTQPEHVRALPLAIRGRDFVRGLPDPVKDAAKRFTPTSWRS